VTILYVAQKIVRYLSIKQQKAIFLYRDDQEITALTKINGIPDSTSIVVIGTANGMIKDFDVKNKCIIRRAKLHSGARVSCIVSQGNYLISCSPENGLIVVYDYKNQQLFRELQTQSQMILKPTSLHLMRGDRYLAVCDDQTLSVIDIEKGSVEKHTAGNREMTKLFKLAASDTQSGAPAFAGVTSHGLLKIWNEVLLDSSNMPVRKDMDPYRLDLLKAVRASGMGIAPSG
jgi:WD40 repeat protein